MSRTHPYYLDDALLMTDQPDELFESYVLNRERSPQTIQQETKDIPCR